ncbi:MAG TPA: hypothetical protein VNJ08_13590 [Bacteriovoracaceae bacterium]|nr:hypothetical protein [Bacteriovoracaceae bacterium]
MNLTWSSASGATSYKIYRRLEGATSTLLQGTTTGLAFTQEKPLTNAVYYVRSVDQYGSTMKSSEVSFRTTRAAPVASLTATLTRVNLKWTSVSGAVSYKVYRKLEGSALEGQLV